jgi:50S ribosomal protein L16 3-hydroxylase
MNISRPLALLGGMSPQDFMRRHWQKKPLLIRQAIPGFTPLLSRDELFALAERDGVESRLVQQKKTPAGDKWSLASGPDLTLPPLKRKHWTLLVQGVDLHHDAVYALMQQFRFVSDARLDDLMISYATEGGGVGPHFDSYDVFLLQAHGKRRWQFGAQKDLTLRDGLPLKILRDFQPTEEFVLEPGDMLYLPPRYAHDGIAEGGDCMTYSVGFRAPGAGELARELLARLADEIEQPKLYADPKQPATAKPSALPEALVDFAMVSLAKALQDKGLLRQLLGESLTEPKANVWFEVGHAPKSLKSVKALRLDRRSRMLVDGAFVFLNGESWRMGGADARLLRKLADQRSLGASDLIAKNGLPAWTTADFDDILGDWIAQGWLHAE